MIVGVIRLAYIGLIRRVIRFLTLSEEVLLVDLASTAGISLEGPNAVQVLLWTDNSINCLLTGKIYRAGSVRPAGGLNYNSLKARSMRMSLSSLVNCT